MPNVRDLYDRLMDLATDEGSAAAIRVGEQWRDTLDEIGEVGSSVEQQKAADLLAPVSQALVALARNV